MRERGGCRPDLAAAEGGTEALEYGVVMSMMAATNSVSEKSAPGGSEGRHGKRSPSGRQRHWPAIGVAVRVRDAALRKLPVATAHPRSVR